jgi:hypothetical protein
MQEEYINSGSILCNRVYCNYIYYILRFYFPYLSLLARPVTIFVYGPVTILVYEPARAIYSPWKKYCF